MTGSTERAFLGIEIGGSKLQIVLGSGESVIGERHRFTVAREGGAEGILREIEDTAGRLCRAHRPKAIGIGFGGPVDRCSGRISRSHQIGGWANFPLAEWVAERVHLPVAVENDANLAALAEAHRGGGRGKDPVFYVTLGSGVGGGLVVGGEIYHGLAPGEAEIGHIRLGRIGGVVEDRCSGWAVDQRVRDSCRKHPQSLLAGLVRESPGSEARHLSRALREGDRVARQVIRETARDLALGLSHVVHLFHPEVIIMGGGLSLLGEPLRRAVVNQLPPLVMEVFRDGLDIGLASLGEDTVPVGALILAARREALQ